MSNVKILRRFIFIHMHWIYGFIPCKKKEKKSKNFGLLFQYVIFWREYYYNNISEIQMSAMEISRYKSSRYNLWICAF